MGGRGGRGYGSYGSGVGCAAFGCVVVGFGSVASYASFAAVMAATKVGFRVCVPSEWMVIRGSNRVCSFCGIWLVRGVWALLM